MAATRLIALHVNKGKTVAQCLADRTDYSQNAAKTNDGEFISSYECDPKTADEEFLLSKRQYQHITGRQQKNNIIAYQIRQSFKPGEITPEEANQVGYETAMRWTKGKHAFIVATHIDKSHIHNHIIYNSTSLDATRKFKNFFLSGLAVQRLSDMVCLEHGLSIITPKPYRERQKRTVYPKKRTQRDELCDAIDAVLKQKPKSFDGFVQALADMGFEFKDGKQPAFKGENQKRFIRLRSLGEGYSKEEIQAVISGKNLHKSKGGSAKAPAPKQFQMLIDIQAKMAEGKTVGYEKWAKKFNRKEAARTVILLKEKGLGNYDDLTAHIENLSARFDALSDSIKVAEKRMVEVQALQQHIKNYRNTRQIYIEYRKSGYSKKFFEEHRQEITIHKAAKQAFDELQITKLPSMQSLYEEFHQLAVQKKQDYAEYRQIRKEKEELLIAKRTVETILNISIYVAQTLTSSFVNHFECSYLLLKPGYMYQAIELQVFDVAHHSEIHNKNLPAQPGQDYCNSYEWYHLTLGFVKAHPKTFLTQYFDEHLGCAKLALECFLSTIPLDHSVSKILPGSQVLGH